MHRCMMCRMDQHDWNRVSLGRVLVALQREAEHRDTTAEVARYWTELESEIRIEFESRGWA